MIPEEVLDKIKERLAIEEIIGEFVDLKKSGQNFKGPCPFHAEKTPSFVVSPQKSIYHCFGCHKGGNIFSFLMELKGLSFVESVELLGERIGLEIKGQSLSPEQKELRDDLLTVFRFTAWFFHKKLIDLDESHPVQLYLKKRKIEEHSLKNFFLGYCGNDNSELIDYLKSQGAQVKLLAEAGLSRADNPKVPFFKNRLIFPIFNSRDQVVGLGGRLLNDSDRGPKYLNSPDSILFKKSRLFYGLKQAKDSLRQNRHALICEGYFDVIRLHQSGYPSSLAPLGTSFSIDQARLVKQWSDQVTLAYDGDSAGAQAAERCLVELVKLGLSPRSLDFEEGQDPDSCLVEQGSVVFEKKLRAAQLLLDKIIDQQSQYINEDPMQRGQKADKVLNLIQNIPNSISRNLYLKRLSEALDLPLEWFDQKTKNSPVPENRANLSRTIQIAKLELVEWGLLKLWVRFDALRSKLLGLLDREVDLKQGSKQGQKSAYQFSDQFWEVFEYLKKMEEDNPGSDLLKLEDAPETILALVSQAHLDDSIQDLETAEDYISNCLDKYKRNRVIEELRNLKQQTQSLNDNPEDGLAMIQQKVSRLSQYHKDRE